MKRIQAKLYLSIVIVLCTLMLVSDATANLNITINDIDGPSNIDSSDSSGYEHAGSYTDAQQKGEGRVNSRDTDWHYYKTITIDHTQIPSDLTDFPFVIELFDADLKQHAQRDGDDIAFFDGTATQLSHEIEEYNPDYSNTEAHLIAWVKTDLSSSVDTVIEIRYGNATMSSQATVGSVWDSNFAAVYHLNEDPSGSAPQMLDSTNNNNDGTVNASPLSSSGKLSDGLEFTNAGSQYVSVPNSASLTISNTITGSAWIYLDPGAIWRTIFSKMSVGQTNDYEIYFAVDNNDFIELGLVGTGGTANSYKSGLALAENAWHHVVFTYDSSTSNSYLYVNGALSNSLNFGMTTLRTNSNPFYIGYNTEWPGEVFDGILDEIRVSNVIRSTDWLLTEYNNQNNPSSFYSITSEYSEETDFTYYKTITIDHTQVASDLTDFPVRIELIDTDLQDYAQTDGDDIAFYDELGNLLPFEIESYNPNYSGTEARVLAWVTTDLNSLIDTTIEMRYGNPTMTSYQDIEKTWNNGFGSIWHLEEDPTGVAPQFFDSGLTNDGTSGGTMNSGDLSTGKLGNAIDFDGVDDYIGVGLFSQSGSWSGLTMSAWVYLNIGGDYRVFSVDQGSGATDHIFGMRFKDDKISARIKTDGTGGASIGYDSVSTLSYNSWFYATITWDAISETVTLYVNGVNFGSTPLDGDTLLDHSLNGRIGAVNIGDRWMNGLIDEVRVGPVARSDDWITTEYANQNNPGSFYSVSSQNVISQDYEFYKQITISKTQVAGNLNDFPIYLSIIDADLKNNAQSDGDDIAFYDQSGIQLAHEIISYDPNYSSDEAKLITWVRTDLSTSEDTIIDMRYGDVTLESQSKPHLVWVNGFNNVWHLEEDPTASAPQFFDSTYRNNGTSSGSMTTGDQVSTRLDQGVDFDGVDDAIDNGVINSDEWSELALSAWVYKYDTGDDRVFSIDFGSTSTDSIFSMHMLNDILRVRIGTDGVGGGVSSSIDTPTGLYDLNTWMYYSITWNAATDEVKFYVNGALVHTASKGGDTIADHTLNARIGGINTGDRYFSGMIDEMRVGGTLRSEEWFTTEYNNQYDPDSFYSISGPLKYGYDNILEENVGGEGEFISNPSSFSSNVDGVNNRGNVASSGNLNSLDSTYSTFSERTSTYSADATGGYFLPGGGTADFRSTAGTIDFWIKFDVIYPGRIWGQDGEFETRWGSNFRLVLDFGTTSSLISTKADWLTNKWYYFAITWNESTNQQSFYWGDESNSPILDAINSTWANPVTSTALTQNNIMSSRGYTEIQDGHIDEFRFWNTDLSLSELGSTYNVVLEGTEPNLQNYYQFEQSLEDLAGNQDLTTSGSYSFSTDVSSDLTRGYYLNQEVQFTLDHTDMQFEYLNIYTGTISAENIGVSYWDGSSWNLISSDLNANSWNNLTINPTTSPFTIKFETSYVSSDSVLDTFQIDYIEVKLHGHGIYDVDVDDNTSDVDSSADKGTHSNFNSEIGLDSTFDTITEQTPSVNDYSIGSARNGRVLVGGATTTSWGTSTGTISFWMKSSTGGSQYVWGQADLFEIRITSSGNIMLEFGSSTALQSATSLTFGKWYFIAVTWNQGTDELKIYLGDKDNAPTVDAQTSSWVDAVSSQPNTQNNFLGSKGGSTFEGEGDDLRFYSNTVRTLTQIQSDYDIQLTGSETGLRAYYRFENNLLDSSTFADHSSSSGTFFYTTTTPQGYQERSSELDLEFSFTNGPYTNTGIVNLAIYTGTLDAEVLQVDVWNGFVWINVISELKANTWNNVSVTSYAASSPLTFRFNDADGSSDGTQSSWQIDAVMLSFVDYNLDWEHFVNSVDTSREYFELRIYGKSSDSESFNVQMWDNVAMDWDTAFATKIGSTLQWYNFTITNYDTIASTMYWRYTGDNEVGDAYQSTLLIDYAEVYAYDLAPIITSTASDFTYNEDDTGNSFSWTATDLNAGTYTVSQNGSSYVSATPWTDSTPIVVPVDGFTKGFYSFTIIVSDDNGNTDTDTAILQVVDGTLPEFTFIPSDVIYNETTTGHSLSWTGTDSYNDTYILYLNDAPVDSGSWDSDVSLNFNIDGLLKGTHNYSLFIYDESGQFVWDNATVTVYDGTDPAFTATQTDIPNYIEGSTGNTISWTVTDAYSGTYSIYRNGSEIYVDLTWFDTVAVVRNIDGLSTGIYNFTIIFSDASGNTVTDMAWVTVLDTTPPSIDDPSDSFYFEGSTGNSITWTVSDVHPNTFTLYRNSSIIFNNFSWQSGTIQIPIDGRSANYWNYTLLIRDKSGNTNQSTVIIHVIDNTPPVLNNPGPITYVEGTIGHSVNWVATDRHPDSYWIERNGTEVTSGTWSSNQQISWSINGLTKGFYDYTIYVNDTTGNIDQHTIIVSVTDGTTPSISHPPNISYVEGINGNTITWTATDSYNSTYTIYINDVIDSSDNPWDSGIPIVENVDGLLKGTYDFTIEVFDSSGNSINDTVTVTVTDGTNPVITPASDQSYDEGTTGHVVNWTAADSYEGIYRVYRNGVINQTGTWTTGVNISYSLDGLSKGYHNITLRVFDASGNTAFDTINVTVSDVTDPFVSDVADFSYNEITIGNSITWTMSDLHPATYQVKRNGELISSGAWSTSVTINIDGLAVGTYNFLIEIVDTSGNLASDTVQLIVYDSTNPVLNSPANIDYSVGLTGNTITWIASDNYAFNYTIYFNLTQSVQTGTWVSGEGITINIDGLTVGEHNYTIVVEDTSGNTASDLVVIKVTAQPVLVSSPGNYNYILGDTGNQLSWTFSDGNPETYVLYRTNESASEEVLVSGSWTSLTPITRDIDGLPYGTYNYTIFVNDTDGFSAVNQLNVTVTDLPIFDLPLPNDVQYEWGNTGNTIMWNATDMFPNIYYIYQDGIQVDTNSWDNATEVIFDIDGLGLGVYNFTIVFLDTVGNQIVDQVDVTVVDISNPFLVASPSNLNYNEGSTGNSLTWNFTDAFSSTYTIKRNGTTIQAGSWTSGQFITVSNIDGLAKAFYVFTINVTDSSGNFYVDTIILEVIDNTPPTINSPANVTYSEGAPGPINVTWSPTDLNPLSYTISRNGSIQIDSAVWDGSSISYDVSGLNKGFYSIILTVVDNGTNSVFDEIIVHVRDTNNPTFVTSSGDFSINEGATNVNVTWTYTDAYAGQYVIELNEVANVSLTSWTSGIPINYTLDGFERGNYNFTIIIYDASGNFEINTILVAINDVTNPDLNDVTDFTVDEGVNGNTIDWTLGDIHPANYTISRNGSILVPVTSWTNDTIQVILDGYTKGFYEFTILVLDDSGNSATDTVIVFVDDVDAPSFTPLGDLQITEGTIDNVLEWIVSDAHPSNFTLTQDGFEVASGSWTSNITWNIDYLTYSGSPYTFVLTVYDTSGNENNEMLTITVLDETDPLIIESWSDFSYIEGDTNINVNWTVTDTNAGTYTITNNSVAVPGASGLWSSGSPIILDISGMPFGEYNFTLTILDDAGNTVIDFIVVTVFDSEDPTFTSLQPDISDYNETSTGNVISWTMNDLNNYSYSIYRDGVHLITANYSNDEAIFLNIDGLMKGVYEFEIVITDLSGNFASDIAIVQVIDGTRPAISGPGTASYFEGGTVATITWTIVENYKSSYIIFQNGTEIESSIWTTSPFNFDAPVLIRGYYNITTVFTDQSGLNSSDTVILHVIDNTPPSINDNTDTTMVEGSSSNNFNWIAIDNHAGTYSIYENNTLTVDSLPWTSGVQITHNLNHLKKGIHNITIEVHDDSGNTQSDEFWITVFDETAPTIDGPTNFFYYEFTTGNVISWNPTDLYADTYEIYIDGVFNTSGTWTNESDITLNVDFRSLGTYNINLTVFDVSGNFISFFTDLQVGEITPPSVNLQPSNSSYIEGTTGNLLTWNFTEANPGTYTLERSTNSGPFESLATNVIWVSEDNITINIDGLAANTYIYRLTIRDTSNNLIIDYVEIIVLDTKDPNLDGPSALTYESGISNRQISWQVSDLHPFQYTLKKNDSDIVIDQPWNNGVNITYTLPTTLQLGYHNYTLTIRDVSGNSNTSTVIVHVVDTRAPLLFSEVVESITRNEGQSYIATWTFDEFNPNNYTISINQVIVSTGPTWANLVPINFNFNQPLGEYNLSITVYDDVGLFQTNTIKISVVDNSAPEFLTTPSNQILAEGNSAITLSWTMEDEDANYPGNQQTHPDRYIIYLNGSVMVNSTWIDNAPRTYNLAGLTKGYYNLTMVITDTSGNSKTHQVDISILDQTLPVINLSPDLPDYIEGSSGNTMTWAASDNYNDTFFLYRNGSQVSTGIWESNQNLVFNIDGLMTGYYNYTIVFYDESGNFVSDTEIIHVIDTTPPVFSGEIPPSFITFNDDEAASISWTVVDNHPATYTIKQDGLILRTRSWTSGVAIVIDLFTLPTGYYDFEILVSDQSGLTINNSLTVRIKDPNIIDTLDPILELRQTALEGDVEIIFSVWDAVENRDLPDPVFLHGVSNGKIVVDLYFGNEFIKSNEFFTDSNGLFNITFDYTALIPSEDQYTWKISFTKDGYLAQELERHVIVEPHKYVIGFDVPNSLRQGDVYVFVIRVQYLNRTQGLVLNEVQHRKGPVIGIAVFAEISYETSQGGTGQVTESSKTDVNGYAIFRISGEITSLMSKITGITAGVSSSPSNIEVSEDYNNVDAIQVNPPLPTLLSRIISWIQEYYLYVLGFIGVLILFSLIFALILKRKRERLKIINQGIRTATEELEAIQGLKAIIIQTSDKLTLYEEMVFESTLNTSLIGGMISAFSSFLNEITADQTMGFEMMERQGANITVHKGRESNFIVISETKVPISMLNQIQKAQTRIESEFKDYFTETSRGVRKLTKTQVYPIFSQALFKMSLTELLSLNERNISRILKLKTVSRALKKYAASLYDFNDSRYVDNGTFYLEDLVQYLDEKGIAHDILSRIVILAWEFDVINATIHEQERVDSAEELFDELDPYDFSDLDEN